MSTQIQRRRGTTAQHSAFTGVEGELTVDTTKDTVVVHDGATTGGRPLLREDQANLPTSVTNGISVPSANQVAISTNGTPRINIEADGDINIDSGGVFYDATNNRLAVGTTSPAAPIHVNPGSGNNGSIRIDYGTGSTADGYFEMWALTDRHYLRTVKSGGGVPLAFEVNSAERARIDSSGRLLVGTSSTSDEVSLLLQGNSASATFASVFNLCRGSAPSAGAPLGVIDFSDNGHVEAAQIIGIRDGGTWTSGSSQPSALTFSTTADGESSPTERMRIDSAGFISLGGDTNTGFSNPSADNLAITTNGSERARIDSSGRLLVGTSSAVTTSYSSGRIQLATPTGGIFVTSRDDSTVAGNTLIGGLSLWSKTNTNHEECASIFAQSDATYADGNKPTRLVFSTCPSGSASPVERMRIDSAGFISLGGDTNTGFSNPSADNLAITTNGSEAARIDSSGRLLVGTSSATGNAKTEIKGGTLSTTEATNKGGMLRLQSGAGNMSTPSSITIADYFSIAPRRVMGVVYATTVDTSGHRARSWKVYGKIGSLSIVDDVNDSSSGGGSTPTLTLSESSSGVLTITPSWAFGGSGYIWSVDLLVGCAVS